MTESLFVTVRKDEAAGSLSCPNESGSEAEDKSMCELKGLMLSGEVQAARGRQQDTGG